MATTITLSLAATGTSVTPNSPDSRNGGGGPGFSCRDLVGYSLQFRWTGTSPVGSAVLQWSNDNQNFTDLTSSSLAITGNTGSDGWIVSNPWYRWVRVSYTRTSGTGTATLTFSGTETT